MIPATLPSRILCKLAHRRPHFHPARKLKAGWHDSYHREVATIQGQCLPDDVRISTHATLPERMAQDDNQRCSGFVFVVVKNPASCRAYPKHLEQISRNLTGDDALRLAAARKVVV